MKRNTFVNLCFGVLALLVVIQMVQLGSAETDTVQVSDTFKINKFYDYSKPCFNNGSYCSSTTECNYTIFNPSQSLLVDNQLAQNQVSRYNITIFPSEIGIYKVDMLCNDNGLTGTDTYYFEATPSGFNESIGFWIIMICVSAGLIIFGFVIKEGWLVIFGGMLLMITGLYSINEGIAGVRNMFTTWATGVILIGVGGYLAVMSALELMDEDD